MSALAIRSLDELQKQAAVDSVRELGFALLPDMLPAAATGELVELCEDLDARFSQHTAGSANADTFHGADTKLLFNLHNKDARFRELMFTPGVLDIAGTLLRQGSYRDSEPFQIALSQARGLFGVHPAQQLHIDSNLPGAGHILVLQAMWVLSPFRRENGATRVVPGSHKRREFAENGRQYDDEIVVEADPGTLVLFDGALWHGSSAKTTDESRWIIVNRYARWFIRPSFDHTQNTPPEVFEELSTEQRELLGFRFAPPRDEFERTTRMAAESELHGPAYRLPE